ncbi:hypothetical protein [Thiorhodococcus minor]|nr:hypothetical protein [Thiorhodococcus minor]
MDHTFEEVLAPNLYYDRHFEMEAVKILPCEYYVSTTGSTTSPTR